MFSVTVWALDQSESLVDHKRGYSPEVVSEVVRGQPSTIRLNRASTIAEIHLDQHVACNNDRGYSVACNNVKER